MNENRNIDSFMFFSQNKSIRRKTMEILSLSLIILSLKQLLVVPPNKSSFIIESPHANSPPKAFPIAKDTNDKPIIIKLFERRWLLSLS